MAKSYRGQKNEWAYSVKDKNHSILTQPEEIADRWRKYFTELLK